MPRIPFVNEPTQKLQRLNAPALRNTATIENLSGGEVELAKEFGVAADKIQDFVIAKQNQLDLTTVQEASSAWKDYEFERKRSAFNKKGSNAKGLLSREGDLWENYRSPLRPEQIEDFHNPAGAEILWDEKDPNAQAAFKQRGRMSQLHSNFLDKYDEMDARQKLATDRIIKDRRATYLHGVGVHEDKERLTAMIAANEKSIKWSATEAIQTGVGTPEQDVKRNKHILEGINGIKANAKAMGMNDKDSLNVDINVYTSTVHQGVIDNLLNSGDKRAENLQTAKQYFKTHEKDINQATRKTIGNRMWKETVDVESSSLAAKALASNNPLPIIFGEKNKEISSAAMVKYRYLETAAAKGDAKKTENSANAVFDWIRQNKGINPQTQLTVKDGQISIEGGDAGTPIDFNNLPPSMQAHYNNLGIKEKNQLDVELKQQLLGVQNIPEEVHSANYEILEKMYYNNPDKFKTLNIEREYGGKLRQQALQSFMKRKTVLLKEGASGSRKDRLADRFDSWGWTGAEYAPMRGTAREAVQNEIDAFIADPKNQGRKPDDKEFKAIVERTLTPQYEKQLEKKYPIAVDSTATQGRGITTRLDNELIAATNKKKTENVQLFAVLGGAAEREEDNWKRDWGSDMPPHVKTTVARRIANNKIYFTDPGDKPDPQKGFFKFGDDDDEYYDKALADGVQTKNMYVLVDDDIVPINKIDAWVNEMDDKQRNQLAGEVKISGKADTYQVLAEFWRGQHPKVVLSSVRIENPDGNKTISGRTLLEHSRGLSVSGMKKARPIILRDYGPYAAKAYDFIIKQAEELKSENE